MLSAGRHYGTGRASLLRGDITAMGAPLLASFARSGNLNSGAQIHNGKRKGHSAFADSIMAVLFPSEAFMISRRRFLEVGGTAGTVGAGALVASRPLVAATEPAKSDDSVLPPS